MGVPPLVGVGVKVTEVPVQTGFAETVMVTLTGNKGLTVMVVCALFEQPVVVLLALQVYVIVETGFAYRVVALPPVYGIVHAASE